MTSKFLVVLFPILLTACNENKTPAYWEKKNFERAQELAQLFEARTFVNNKGTPLLVLCLALCIAITNKPDSGFFQNSVVDV